MKEKLVISTTFLRCSFFSDMNQNVWTILDFIFIRYLKILQ